MERTALDAAFVPEYTGQTDDGSANTPQDDDGAQVETTGQEAGDTTTTEVPATEGQGDTDDNEAPISQKEYKELRKFATQKSMEAAALKKQLTERGEQGTSQAATVQQQPFTQPTTVEEYIEYTVNERMGAALAPLQQQQQDLQIQSTVMKLSEQYEDFEDIAPSFVETLEANPMFFDLENGMEMAFKIARADTIDRQIAARVKAGVASAKATTAQKLSATETAPIVKAGATSATSDADSIRDAIMGIKGHSSIFG